MNLARCGALVCLLLAGGPALAQDMLAFHSGDEVREARRCRRLVRQEMPGRKVGRHLQSLRIAAVQRCVMTNAF